MVGVKPAWMTTYTSAGSAPGLTSWIGLPAGTTAASPARRTGPSGTSWTVPDGRLWRVRLLLSEATREEAVAALRAQSGL